jgi:hypothetical protein
MKQVFLFLPSRITLDFEEEVHKLKLATEYLPLMPIVVTLGFILRI